MSTFTNLYIFDADGVLVEPNQTAVPKSVLKILRKSNALKVVASGKSLERCWEIGNQINAEAVFGENGAVYQFRGDSPRHTVDMTAIATLKTLIHFRVTHIDPPQATITLNGKTSRMLYEPGKDILTLWTRAVSGRWDSFEGSLWEESFVIEKMREIIRRESLNINIVGPHSDGGIDFNPYGVDKSQSIKILKEMFPALPVFVFVDGDNDKELAEHPDAFVVTFSNATETIMSIARQKIERGMGCVLGKPGYQSGLTEALKNLES